MASAIAKYKKENENSYALGATLVFELLENKIESTLRIAYSSKAEQSIIDKLRKRVNELGKGNSVEFFESDRVVNALSSKENCFVLGEFKKYACELKENAPHIVLVNPSNTGNLGTIIRSSVGFNALDIAIISPAADCFDPKTIRASMGSIFKSRVEYFSSFSDYQKKFGGRNFYSFMLKGALDLRTCGLENDLKPSLIFGNEATGLPDEFEKIGKAVKICHSSDIDSLNLQSAVTIALYQLGYNKKY